MGWVPVVPWLLAHIIDLTGRPGKSFFHLVQGPHRVITIGKRLPEMLHFLLKELKVATDCFGPMGEGTNDTIYC